MIKNKKIFSDINKLKNITDSYLYYLFPLFINLLKI